MKISLNNYLNVFSNVARCRNGYDIGDLRVIEVDKNDLMKMIVESDINSDIITLGVEVNGEDPVFGAVSNSKMKTAINILKKKARDGTYIDDFVAFNKIQKDIGNITVNLRNKEWKKKKEE